MLATAIGSDIQHELAESARRRIDGSAYGAFHGKYELAKRMPDALRNARHFKQAIDQDKNDGLRR